MTVFYGEDRKPIDVMAKLASRVETPASSIATEPYFMVTRKLLDGSLDCTLFSESEMLESNILGQANDDLFQLDYLTVKKVVM